MPYELFIGLRYLRSRRPSTLVSFITVISTLGVALGVLALIVVIAVMSGFERELREKILGTKSHVLVLKAGDGMLGEPARIVQAVRAVPGVAAASPFTLHQVMLVSARGVAGAVLQGIDPASKGEVGDLAKALRLGSLADLAPAPVAGRDREAPLDGVLLGRTLAFTLGVTVGEPVTVLSPLGGGISPLGVTPRLKRFRVAGVFSVGMHEYDSGLAYVAIPAAQQFFRLGEAVTGVEVRLHDFWRAGEVAEAIQERLGPPHYARTWMQMYQPLFSALRLEKITMFVILVMIVVVASFGIVSTLSMAVVEKRKEIAILKAMGATAGSILKVFLVKGLVIGLAGTALGVAGGLSITFNLDPIVAFLERLLGVRAFPAEVYFLDRLPHQVNPGDLGTILLCSLAIAFLATVYPALQASRLDPVEAMRYE
ncbi:MAG: lipoprotein-releasing ABC transporter permease subunit [candidate division NC10 bacterium]|nr:lipoprotein-releasing ABC transporter permease subunit [candidate division NC10 bacterium]